MRATPGRLQVYTVVEVWRGLAQSVRNFRRLEDAQAYAQRLRRRQNPTDDEVALFKSSLRAAH